MSIFRLKSLVGWVFLQVRVKYETKISYHTALLVVETPGLANINGNEEADRLAKEASCEAAAMTSDTDVVTMTDIKQAAVKMGLSQWQRQWESSEMGRSLFRYKPHVTDRSQIDFPNTISYRNIAKLR